MTLSISLTFSLCLGQEFKLSLHLECRFIVELRRLTTFAEYQDETARSSIYAPKAGYTGWRRNHWNISFSLLHRVHHTCGKLMQCIEST